MQVVWEIQTDIIGGKRKYGYGRQYIHIHKITIPFRVPLAIGNALLTLSFTYCRKNCDKTLQIPLEACSKESY